MLTGQDNFQLVLYSPNDVESVDSLYHGSKISKFHLLPLPSPKCRENSGALTTYTFGDCAPEEELWLALFAEGQGPATLNGSFHSKQGDKESYTNTPRHTYQEILPLAFETPQKPTLKPRPRRAVFTVMDHEQGASTSIPPSPPSFPKLCLFGSTDMKSWGFVPYNRQI